MSQLLSQAMSNPWVWIFSIILPVVLGIILDYCGKKKKIFTVASSSYEIVKQGQSKNRNILIKFGDKEVDNLSVSKFAIWNSGNTIINGSDIVDTQKLRLTSDNETEILDAQIISEIEECNKFIISESSRNKVIIDFDYVEKNEGIVLQVIHTGEIDSIDAQCKIKGGKPIKTYRIYKKKDEPGKLYKKVMNVLFPIYVGLFAVVLFIVACVLTYLAITGNIPQRLLVAQPEDVVVSCVILWVTAFMFGGLGIRIIKHSFLVGIPAKLKLYADTADE